MTRAYIRETPSEDLPNLTVDILQYRVTQFWTLCLNRDEPPIIKDLPSDSRWVADIWSQIQRNIPKPMPPIPAPLAAAPVTPPLPPPAPRVVPKVAAAVPTKAGDPQPLCVKYNRKTVYLANGHSWRCVQ